MPAKRAKSARARQGQGGQDFKLLAAAGNFARLAVLVSPSPPELGSSLDLTAGRRK